MIVNIIMFDLEPVFAFSRNNCVAICAFIVPGNLLITLQILIALAMERPSEGGGAGTRVLHSRPPWQIFLAIALAITLALTLFLHVFTWFAIGVVTPVTFILFGLGTTCLIINIWTLIYWQKFPQLGQSCFADTAASLRKTIFFLSSLVKSSD